MSVVLSPVGNGITFLTSAGVVLNGGKINTYAAGSSTPTATYTSSSGLVANANPIILGSNGVAPNEIWLTVGQAYKFVITDSGNNVLMTLDNLSGINDFSSFAVAGAEWIAGPTPTYVSTTQFTVVGNQTATFHPGRRVLSVNTGGTFYGTITASVFTSLTTVTVGWDSGNLDAGLSAVSYGIVSFINTSDPLVQGGTATIASAASLNLDTSAAVVITGTATVTAVTLANGKSKTLIAQSTGLAFSNGASLLTPNALTLTAAAGDQLTFRSLNGKIYVTINRILMPAFNAINGSQNFSSGGGNVKLTISTAEVNIGSCFDAVTNYRFTPTVPGTYYFIFTGQQSGASSGSTTIQFFKNGVAASAESIAPGSANANIAGSAVIALNGTSDYVEMWCNQASTFTLSVCSLSGFKIDP